MRTSGLFSAVLALVILTGLSSPPAVADSCVNPEFAGARISGVGSLINGGGAVQGMLVADLNGDTNADVVAINVGCGLCTPPITNSLSVLLGNGDGTFLTNFNYITSLSPKTVAAGDFNGDQRPEVVVGFAGSPVVSVFFNNGNGTFQPPVSVNVSNSGANVIAADLNIDGNLDLVAFGNKVALGNGNGTFQPTTTITFSGPPASTGGALATDDFNGDGAGDYAMQSFDQFTFEPLIVTVLGSTNSTLQTVTNSVGGVVFQSLGAGDFNGDTFPDIVGGSGSNFVAVCLNRSDGTFQTNVNYAISTNGVFVAVADFNGDHTPDIAVASTFNAISILLGNSNGTFQPASNYPLGGHAIPSYITTGDINGDGISDLVAAGGSGANGVSVMLGNGDGTFHIAPAYRTGDGPINPQAGDFNGDGKRDLVVANNFTNSVSVLLNSGDGTFGTNVSYTTGRGAQSVALADFNKDNNLDLIVANTLSNQVSLWLGLGNGTFQTNFAIRGPALIGSSWNAVAGDFNGDTNTDFVVGTIFGIAVFPGNGGGGFQTNSINTAVAPVMISGDTLVTGDFNNDTKLDIAYSKTGSNIVCIVLGNGAGGFGVNNNFPMVSSNIVSVATADFNSDGKLDLVAIHYPSCPTCANPYQNDAGNLTIRLGNGNGTFQPPLHYSVPAYFLWSIVTGDFNGDGKPDVAVTDIGVGEVWVLLGKGNGSFETPVRFGVQLTPESLCPADLDGNGTIDLVAANKASDTLSVLLNTCPFAPPAGLAVLLTPAVATNAVSTAHTVTATVTSNNVALAGVPVTFSVTAGPDVGQNGASNTVANGQAAFTYTNNGTPGIDIIRAVTGTATGTATKVWLDVMVPPTITCPSDITTNNANGQCARSLAFNPIITGSPAPNVTCKIGTTVITSPHSFPVGISMVDCVASNSGGTASCSFNVTVNDSQPPTIVCPGSTITTNVSNGQSNAVVNFAVTFTDNCSMAASNCSPASGSTFPLGTNAVVCTAMDDSGNTNSCAFTVVVAELPPEPHDLAVLQLKAPKKVTLKAGTTPKPGKVQVTIQNLGPQTETFPTMQSVENVVRLNIESLGGCAAPTAVLQPLKSIPTVLAPNKKLKLTYLVTIDCPNDPLSGAGHEDYSYSVTVIYVALGGQPDTMPANNDCPRPPSGTDKGCGNKTASGALGAPVLTDVVVK